MTDKENFLDYLHSFRGFAILCIVIVHVGVMPLVAANDFQEADRSDPIFIVNEALFHDSTIYFALISGLLFSAVLRTRGWKRFYRSKFLYVFLPYLFFSALLSIGKPPEEAGQSGSFHPDIWSYLSLLGKNLLLGKAMPIYWYLPVLFILYFVTPLFAWLSNSKIGSWLLLPVILTPLVISRQELTFDDSFPWQNPLYFLGVYVFGMWWGQRLDQSLQWINKNRIFLLLLVFASLAGLIFLYTRESDLIAGFTSMKQSLHYINKLAISAVALGYFSQLSKQPQLITILANDSFAIYFIHFFFIFLAMGPLVPFIQNEAYYPYNILISIPIILVLTLLLTKGLIWIFQKVLKKYSRMVIGS